MAHNDLCIQALTLNVRGLVSYQKRLTVFEWLRNKHVQIAALQETHCTAEFINEFDINWNGQIWHSPAPSKYSSGTCILFSKDFNVTVINHIIDNEGRKILLNINLDGDDTSIISVYAPNNIKNRKDFLTNLVTWTNEHALNPNNLIILGDFNTVLNKTDRCSNFVDSSTKDFLNFTRQLKVKDTGSNQTDQHQHYTWQHPGDNSRKSRIDYIFISHSMSQDLKLYKTLIAIISDHKGVLIKLDKTRLNRGPGYWKLNISHLADTKYVMAVQKIIQDTIVEYDLIEDKRLVWDLIKILVRDYSIRYGVQKAREKRQETAELEKQIDVLEVALAKHYCTEFKQKRDELSSQLTKMLFEKAKGAQIRARAKYIEDGERSTAYFLSLEKHHQKHNVITKLVSDDIEYNGNADILHHMTCFYQNLYESKLTDTEDLDDYMLNLHYEHTLTSDDKNICDKDITKGELRDVIFKKMPKNKSPGLDGLPVEFYQKFWKELEDFFVILIDTIYTEGQLSNTQRKSVMTLLYKKGDKTNISNYRPLSLTGTDYKIIAFVLAERLQKVIHKLINSDQSGYIKGRFIGTNIRLVDDIIWYANRHNLPGAILFLDFKKAFDSLEWDYMF